MKNTSTKIKYLMDRLKCKVDTAEERTDELRGRTEKITQNAV